ncbi:MAG: transposase [Actinomycetota bacterium]|nr:transposase [Actinomycetota bacterium]
MPRIPRCAFPDGLFHVAARGVAKMPIYHDASDRQRFLSLLALVVSHFEWTCHAFCLMTNHYHLVLDTSRENLSGGMQILNGDYAQGFNGKYGRWGHVFGDRFWCRSLGEEELEGVCLYVMENPVRAGLCKRSTDWRWSACRFELG